MQGVSKHLQKRTKKVCFSCLYNFFGLQKCLVNQLLNNRNKQKCTFEEGSTGIESKREKTSPYNTENQSVDLLAEDSVNYCSSNDIENPVEILRHAQSLIVTRRPLDVQDTTVSLEGETNFILINRQDFLRSAMEELQFLKDPRLTLVV